MRSLDGPTPDAPVLILVHGAGVSSRYLSPSLVTLARWFRVLAPDLPGFGRSSKPPGALDVDELADALVDWMDAVGIPRATLLGNSVGCQVIASVAGRRPDRVRALVMLGPTMDPGAPSLLGQGVRWVRAAFVEPPSLLLVLVLEYFDSGPLRFLRTTRAALRDRLEDRIPNVAAPALVVRGGRDPIVSAGWTRRVAKGLPRGRLVVIPQGGHALPYDSPRAVARVVHAFSRSLAERR